MSHGASGKKNRVMEGSPTNRELSRQPTPERDFIENSQAAPNRSYVATDTFRRSSSKKFSRKVTWPDMSVAATLYRPTAHTEVIG